MNRTMIAVAVAATLAAGVPLIHANEMKNMTPEQKQQKLSEKIQKMDQRLNLTTQQEAQIKTIMQQKMDGSIQKDQAHQQIEAVLTPEQRPGYQTLMKEWETKKDQKHKG